MSFVGHMDRPKIIIQSEVSHRDRQNIICYHLYVNNDANKFIYKAELDS